jgi:cytochrome P450
MLQESTQKQNLLPPLLPQNDQNRLPSKQLMARIGFVAALYLHNYHKAGPIYRHTDFSSREEKVVLAGTEANQFVMKHGKTHFSARQFRQTQLDELQSDKYLVGMDGDEHYRYRKLQKDGYSRSQLDDRHAELADIVRREVAGWQPGQSIPVYRLFQQIAAQQLSATILNHPLLQRWPEVCAYVKGLLVASFSRKPMAPAQRERYENARRETMALMDEILTSHHNQKAGHCPADLVGDLLTAEAQDGDLFKKQDLRVSALTVFIAGIEPVAHTATFMLHALLQHPRLLAKVVDEIDAALDDGPLSPDSLRNMHALRGAMLETLRLYPFTPVLQMTSVKPFEFKGYHVEPDTTVVVAITVPHFLPQIFPDPFRFDIERYSRGGAHRQPGAFVPYGVGPHLCLGAGLSQTQIMVTIAALLRMVRVEPDPSSPPPLVGTPTMEAFRMRAEGHRQ